jgi:hypothetical protein
MIHRIATILKDRIAAFTYVDKIGGLVRVARQNREGREIVIPVAGDVDEAYACDPATIRDMVPDDRYGCMVYFEDRGTTRITERTRGTSYRASLRLVCWVNTLKFGSDPTTADRILEQFTNDLNVGQPYNTDTLIGLKHSVEGFPQRGASIFSQYTYPEAERQYLLWPFDAFALDITATYRIKPGCEEAPVPDDDACWTPPVTRKRRNPSEFTCDELLDPVTGLTAAQLGPECLDCGGGGTCDPLTWTLRDEDGNLLEQGSVTDPCGDALPLTAPNASVLRDGAAYGTVLSGGSIDVPSDCPCDPLTVTVNDTIEYATVDEPCGATTNVEVVNEADEQVGTLVTGKIVVPTAKSLCELVTEGTSEEVAICVISSGKRPGVLAEIIPTVPEGDTVAQVYDVMTPAQQDLFDVTVQLQDSAASPIGAPDVYAAGTTTTKTAPDGTVLRDGSPYGFVKSNGSIDVPSNIPAGDPIIYAFGPELWSGQTSSYRTGDEQSIRAAGWFDYSPSFGSSSQKQYLTSWLTLGVPNHFGNTNRFTDTSGGAFATSGERTFIDHFTRLQWYIPADVTLTAQWNAAIDAALASTYDGNTDWKVPPIKVWYSVALYNSGSVLNYGPFNIATAIVPWSSTTSPASTAQALRLTNALGAASATNKTSTSQHGIFVRRWTP